jgi:hypothetical protein
MRHRKIFRILGLVVVLALLMAVMPATPALAFDRDIELDPEQGEIGDEITITGDDWRPSYEDGGDSIDVGVDIYFALDDAETGDYINSDVNTYEMVESEVVGYEDDSDEGEFDATFDVPDRLNDGSDDEDVEPGTYYVYVTDRNSLTIRALAEFTVMGSGEIAIDPEEGPVGTEVEISGTDFGDEEDIVIEFDGDEIADDETDSDGEFEITIEIPESIAGDHDIKVIGEDSLAEVTATFTVEPGIAVSPTEGGVQSTATVSGTGFAKRSDITVYLDGDEVATDTTDSDGSFKDASFDVPDLTIGEYDIEVWDEDDNLAEAEFSVIISISASTSPAGGPIGTEVTVTGEGYLGGSTVTIKYDTTEVATATAGTDGSFTTTFEVPPSQSGAHDITVSDGTTAEIFTFTVESDAPPIPKPSLPEMGVKAKQPVEFDWGDVADASDPVTSTLQIATSESFSAGSIVLEKAGLTSSEYALTTQLEPATKDSPYFWRVIATDAAGNESQPTGAGSFYTGGAGFGGLPSWLTYLLIALGVLLLGFLAFWLGRRTAYYSY